MRKRVARDRPTPAARCGANRALLSIPRGALAQTRRSNCGEPPAAENAPAEAHSQACRARPDRELELLGRAGQEEMHRLRVDENRKLRAYLAPLFDALPCGVLIADSQNRFQLANAEACRILFGRARRGVAGPGDLAGLETEMARVLEAIAETKSCIFRLDWAHRAGAADRLGTTDERGLVKIARICLSAEQGIAPDRVYLLQAAAGVRLQNENQETGEMSGAERRSDVRESA